MGSASERIKCFLDFRKDGSLPADWNSDEQKNLLRQMTSANAIDRPTAAE
ncbi:hypothetical protein L195_g062737, partial [Trifolium pratense]